MAKLGKNPIVVTAAMDIMRVLGEKLSDDDKEFLETLNDLENNTSRIKDQVIANSLIKETREGESIDE